MAKTPIAGEAVTARAGLANMLHLLALALLLVAMAVTVATCVQAQRIEAQLDDTAKVIHGLPRVIEYCGNPRCTCGADCKCCRCGDR